LLYFKEKARGKRQQAKGERLTGSRSVLQKNNRGAINN
jgi:hypothetical protein